MKLTPRNRRRAQRVAKRPPFSLPDDRRMVDAPSKSSRKNAGNDMIELTVIISERTANETTLREWLTDTIRSLKLRQAAEGVGAWRSIEGGQNRSR